MQEKDLGKSKGGELLIRPGDHWSRIELRFSGGKKKTRGQPCGRVVKFTHSALVAQCFAGLDPGRRPSTAHQAMLRWCPT